MMYVTLFCAICSGILFGGEFGYRVGFGVLFSLLTIISIKLL